MEPFIFFIKGIVVGFAVAAPVGPVAVLCIRRTLANGLISGFATGIGAAVADMFYGAVAALGIGFVADLLAEHQIGFRILGGVVLVFMAARMLRASPREQKDNDTGNRLGDFFSALVITGTNPITLVAFGVVFSAIGVATAGENFNSGSALIAGVLVGATAWWFALAGLTALFSRFVGTFPILWVNRISAAIVLASGVFVLIAAVAPDSRLGRMVDLPAAGQSAPSSTSKVR